MKTTLDIEDSLLRRAKAHALERGTTLRAVVEEALQRSLGMSPKREHPLRILSWPQAPGRLIDDARLLAAIKLDRQLSTASPNAVLPRPSSGRPSKRKPTP